MTETPEHGSPHQDATIRVVRGNPTREELAAAVAVVRGYAAASSTAAVTSPPVATEWTSRVRGTHGQAPLPGPDAWRTSYWPR